MYVPIGGYDGSGCRRSSSCGRRSILVAVAALLVGAAMIAIAYLYS